MPWACRRCFLRSDRDKLLAVIEKNTSSKKGKRKAPGSATAARLVAAPPAAPTHSESVRSTKPRLEHAAVDAAAPRYLVAPKSSAPLAEKQPPAAKPPTAKHSGSPTL